MALSVDLLLLIIAYLLGAIPTGLIVGLTFRKTDLRTVGSGNIGATNAWRTFGWKLGLLTFATDVAKAALGVLLAVWLGGGIIWQLPILAGLAVLLGNFFNIFLGGKGGKGVATSLGVFLALAPGAILIGLAVFGIVLKATRYVSAASITAALIMPPLVAAFQGIGPVFWLMLSVSVLVIWKHRANITRLRNGTEAKIRSKKNP